MKSFWVIPQKPQPIQQEIFEPAVGEKVLASNYACGPWEEKYFSHKVEGAKYPYFMDGDKYGYRIIKPIKRMSYAPPNAPPPVPPGSVPSKPPAPAPASQSSTANPDKDGWICWAGFGACPVPHTSAVWMRVKFADGSEHLGYWQQKTLLSNWDWQNSGVPQHLKIVKYKII